MVGEKWKVARPKECFFFIFWARGRMGDEEQKERDEGTEDARLFVWAGEKERKKRKRGSQIKRWNDGGQRGKSDRSPFDLRVVLKVSVLGHVEEGQLSFGHFFFFFV